MCLDVGQVVSGCAVLLLSSTALAGRLIGRRLFFSFFFCFVRFEVRGHTEGLSPLKPLTHRSYGGACLRFYSLSAAG